MFAPFANRFFSRNNRFSEARHTTCINSPGNRKLFWLLFFLFFSSCGGATITFTRVA